MHTHTLFIEKIISGGLGLGHLPDGLVVMIPDVLPEEEVTCRLHTKKKGYALADLVQVVVPSPHRIKPTCPVADQCGGCDLQHADYDLQLQIKGSILTDHLLSARIIQNNEVTNVIQPPIASPQTFGYRQRIRMRVEHGRPGFLQVHSKTMVAVNHCPLARPEINEFLATIHNKTVLPEILRKCLELEILFNQADGGVVLLLHLAAKPRAADIKTAELIPKQLPMVQTVFLKHPDQHQMGPFGASDPYQMGLNFPAHQEGRLPEYSLHFEPGGFCQVNLEQNRNMINQLLTWSSSTPPRRVLDLFCGMGNFSIPMAYVADRVVGMDLQRSSIRSARRNAETLGLTNCNFERISAEDGIREVTCTGQQFDLLLLDPPRRGCKEIIQEIKSLGRPPIIMISCDPATLTRDLAGILPLGYRLNKAGLVDMFPQTHHLETMVQLLPHEPNLNHQTYDNPPQGSLGKVSV
ncbi:MAG: 23S rRNA (uracil(1939)-C(5))-methyltransferase RlmD [Proteobacteria bacterium]|nr:23S rRNA (uracil(1939)-C(5))-methyltransferase RlmD [Pseudomonadota bacterium]MBU1686472.1 23S rRNA (uracil(1939)-C(5))-methyltransferase RlmD [Pseudomonadota bacterium]